MVRLTKDEIT